MIDPAAIVRTLKGAPLAVLMVLAIQRSPLGKEYLATMTGYTDKPVSQALDLLSRLGWVTGSGRAGQRTEAWQINAQRVDQLPFTIPLLEGEKLSRNFSDSMLTTTTLNVESIDSPVVVVFKKELSRNFSDSIVNKLHDIGIMGKKAQELAALDWMTEDYIHAHWLRGKEENTPMGILITRLKDHDPAPALNPKTRHLADCRCDACARASYLAYSATEEMPDEPAEPPSAEACKAWTEAEKDARQQFSPREVSAWWPAAELVEHDEETNTFYVAVPANECGRRWLDFYAKRALEEALQNYSGHVARLVLED